MSMITELVERLRESADDTELDMECSRACDGECNKLLREAADVIEELSTKLQAANMERSSQYYNGGWIPCSERLPEEHEWIGTKTFGTTISDNVFVTLEATNGKRFTDYTRLQNGKLSLSKQAEWDTISKGIKLIAWMPSPEPYKAESEE